MASPAYEKRLASHARKIGKPVSTLTPAEKRAARGHSVPEGTTEARERRRKTVRKYGVSPGQLTKLRAQALKHVLLELDKVGTKGPIDDATVRLYVNHMPGDWLRDVLEMSGAEIRERAADKESETADDIAYEFNPFWYHAAT
jgi:hypothetical protein